jgi:DNA-binding protein
MRQENIVYIGRKPVMNYVMAVLTNINNSNTGKVVLKARGKSITTAVDVAEITRSRYITGLKPSIEISTETIKDGDQVRNVSSISITLSKEIETYHSKVEIISPGSEIEDITHIKGIGAVTAKKLIDGGYPTVSKILSASASELSASTGLSIKQADRILKSAAEL